MPINKMAKASTPVISSIMNVNNYDIPGGNCTYLALKGKETLEKSLNLIYKQSYNNR